MSSPAKRSRVNSAEAEMSLVFIDCVCVFQFVEKRKEMKTEGRMEKELEEGYCFLLTDSVRVGNAEPDR